MSLEKPSLPLNVVVVKEIRIVIPQILLTGMVPWWDRSVVPEQNIQETEKLYKSNVIRFFLHSGIHGDSFFLLLVAKIHPLEGAGNGIAKTAPTRLPAYYHGVSWELF